MLVLGPDVHNVKLDLGESANFFTLKWGWLPVLWACKKDPHVQVTTRTIQTKAIAYLQDEFLSDELTANLAVKLQDLKSTDAFLDAIDTVELGIALARVSNLTSEGILSRARRKRLRNPFELKPAVSGSPPAAALTAGTPPVTEDEVPDTLAASGGWLSLIHI